MSDPPSDPLSQSPSFKPGNLQFLRKQAKALLRNARKGDAGAKARIAAATGSKTPAPFQLSDAQFVIAKEAGFANWPALHDELRWRSDVRAKHRLGSATPLQPGENMNDQSLKLGPIDQIGLSCTDLEQARHFYADVLGFRPSGEVPGVMKFFDCDGVNLVLFQSPAVGPNSVIYFRVEPGQIEDKVRLLKSRAVHVESDAHVIARNWNGADVWLAFFRDPFGNLLALKSHVPTKQDRNV